MSKHIPVLLNQVIDLIEFKDHFIIADTTLGGGGHSLEILRRFDNLTLICFDVDSEAIENFCKKLLSMDFIQDRLSENGYKFTKDLQTVYVFKENFSEINKILRTINISKIDFLFSDFGWSTDQLQNVEGLSYSKDDSLLDMRLDKELQVTASDFLNVVPRKKFAELLMKFSDMHYKFASYISKQVEEKRKFKKFRHVEDLTSILDTVKTNDQFKIRSQVFQCLRIIINGEFDSIEKLIFATKELLNINGVACFITFHSAETSVLLNSIGSSYKVNGPIKPTVDEIIANPSSRSAQLYYFLNTL